MLRRGTWHTHPTGRDEIVGYIERAGLPVFEPVVRFAERFGGVEYPVRGDRGLRLGLVWYWAPPGLRGVVGLQVHGWQKGERYLFDCARHPAAQSWFALDQVGVLHVDFAPVASSIEAHIESDAMVDALMDEQPAWLQLLFGEAPRGEGDVDERLRRLGPAVVPEASDAYTTWWHNDEWRVHRHVPWDGRDDRDQLVAYAKTEAAAERLAAALPGTSFSTRPARLPWPRQAGGTS